MPDFVILVVWSALVVGWLGAESFIKGSLKSYLLCTWFNSWIEGHTVGCVYSLDQGARGAFMNSCLTVSHMCFPCLPGR